MKRTLAVAALIPLMALAACSDESSTDAAPSAGGTAPASDGGTTPASTPTAQTSSTELSSPVPGQTVGPTDEPTVADSGGGVEEFPFEPGEVDAAELQGLIDKGFTDSQSLHTTVRLPDGEVLQEAWFDLSEAADPRVHIKNYAESTTEIVATNDARHWTRVDGGEWEAIDGFPGDVLNLARPTVESATYLGDGERTFDTTLTVEGEEGTSTRQAMLTLDEQMRPLHIAEFEEGDIVERLYEWDVPVEIPSVG